jgi:hypothetical protein
MLHGVLRHEWARLRDVEGLEELADEGVALARPPPRGDDVRQREAGLRRLGGVG